MPTIASSLPWLIALAPLGVALLLAPFARLLPRSSLVVATLIAWLSSTIAAGLTLRRVLSEGGFRDLQVEGAFRGARLVALDLSWSPVLVADPLGALLSLAFALAAGVVFLNSMGAWGGGPRATPRPLSGGQLLVGLLLYGFLQVAALSASLTALLSAVMLASVTSFALLSSADPKREQRDGAGNVFVLQRVGDVAFVLALLLTLTSWGTGDLSALAKSSAELEPWTRMREGPFAGFPARVLFQATGLFVLVGVASRIPLLPLPMLYRQATGLPAPALALVHGLGSFALGLVVLLRTAPLWDRSELLVSVVTLLAAGSALVAALAASTSRDLLRIDLHFLHALAALAVVAALVGQMPAAALLLLTLVLVAPCLLAASGAVLEALAGRADPFAMGGLWRSLKLSDRTRAFSTLALSSLPPFALWLALERTLFESLDSRFAEPAVAALLVVTAAALTFAGFRALHLVYSGEQPRQPPPANLVEARWWRALPPLLVGLAAVAVPAVVALPPTLGGLLLPGYQELFERLLEPVWLSLSFEPLTGDSTRALARQGVPPAWRYAGMALLALVGVVGYALSAALYRKGPTKWHQRLSASGVPERTAALAESTLALERVFLSWLPGVVMQAARVTRTVVLGVVLEGLITRSVLLAGALARTLIRRLHNGDVQRALLFGLLVAVAVLLAWGRV